MKSMRYDVLKALALVLIALPLAVSAQAEDPAAPKGGEAESGAQSAVKSEVTVGAYYLDDDSYRFGKFTGLTDEGVEALVDFRIEKRPQWDSDDTIRWRIQGWRLGLDSRRLKFDFNQQGTQSFSADYREIPNNRFSDGLTPYRGVGSANLTLPSSWEVAPGSSDTRGFLTLDENLASLKIDTKRQRLDLSYDRKLGMGWSVNLDYRHETKKGERTLGSPFGSSGGNPRSVILPAPVDWTTDNIEAMFEWGTSRAQFGFGAYASFFSNDEISLTWQNAFGRQAQWDESVSYPDAQGRMALEPDNSYLQFKAYGGLNLGAATRITADAAFGQMEQDETLLPYTINPNLIVHTPVPRQELDAEIDTTMFNVRLTTQLARRLGIALNYRYDDRDNKTPRDVYPYIGGDSQDQRPFGDGRINLPYSYREQNGDAIATYRFGGNTRIKGGVEYSDYQREYSEVSDADEWAWVGGVKIGALEHASFSFDYRNASRDVTAYIGNTPLIESHLPGAVEEDEFENHPLLRKYFLTDRDREELRFRADFFPAPQFNAGLAVNYYEDDYGEGYFGLNEAKVRLVSVDLGWYPFENVALVGYYTREEYDSDQSSRSFAPGQDADPLRNWFAESNDDVDTWNLSLSFSDVGADHGWKGFDFGFDFTHSNTESEIVVTAVTLATKPLPDLRAKLRSVSAWATIDVGTRSSIRLALENSKLDSADFSLDNVAPDTLANVLVMAVSESAANYNLILVTGSFTYRF
jgi:MtrB/PioB family decaheme-associated outer membrane protein